MSRESEKNEEVKEFDPMTGNYIEKKPKKIEDIVKDGEGGAFSDLEAFKATERKIIYDAKAEQNVPVEDTLFGDNKAKIILGKKENEEDLEVAKSIGVPLEISKEYNEKNKKQSI